MTFYMSSCAECGVHCDWVPHPDHGYWAHRGPMSDHEPRIDWQPFEEMNNAGEWETK